MKHRKILSNWQAEPIVAMMQLIETQSKPTIVSWCLDYAQTRILPVFERRCPGDARPRRAIEASRAWFSGKMKLPAVKAVILNECHAAARELDHDSAAQAAARACGQAASCCHVPAHALGLAYYGAAAVAYDEAGTCQSAAIYEEIFARECRKLEAALLAAIAQAGGA